MNPYYKHTLDSRFRGNDGKEENQLLADSGHSRLVKQ